MLIGNRWSALNEQSFGVTLSSRSINPSQLPSSIFSSRFQQQHTDGGNPCLRPKKLKLSEWSPNITTLSRKQKDSTQHPHFINRSTIADIDCVHKSPLFVLVVLATLRAIEPRTCDWILMTFCIWILSYGVINLMLVQNLLRWGEHRHPLHPQLPHLHQPQHHLYLPNQALAPILDRRLHQQLPAPP
jgi:hypothetical protein